jgi:gamma-glutamyltranspeptidase / glutathione hydrolase
MRNQIQQQPDEHHSVDWATTRPVVSGSGGVISSGHPLVSMAGMRMLLSGGNAFDAAAAAGFAAAVIEPTASYSLCSECVAIIHDAKGDQTLVLSGQGPAPALATIATFAKNGFPRIPTGPGRNAHLSFTVPGAVDAYLKLLETFGTRTIVEVLAPALEYAEQGFPMYEYMHRMLSIRETRSQFALYPPGGEAVFYPGGRTPQVGERFRQPALAGTLKKLVAAGAQGGADRLAGIRAVRERFYRGDIVVTIGAFSEKWGGLLRAADLADYHAQFEPPLAMTFAGREILGQSAWTQAPVVMQALGLLQTFDLKAMGIILGATCTQSPRR